MSNLILPKQGFILFALIILISTGFSCSSTKSAFNASEYYNHYDHYENFEDLGYHAIIYKPVFDSVKSVSDSSPFHINKFTFPKVIGGMQALNSKVKYPREARKQKIEGKVIAVIYIDEHGEVQNIEIAESPHGALSSAVIKAINFSDFKPGILNGKPVKAVLAAPVFFRLRY